MIWNRKSIQRYSNPSHFANQMLGPQHCDVLPFFHAFTGCDLVSSMLGIGKKTAWNAWNAYPKVTNTFVAIIQDPSSLKLDSLHMRRLEDWTILMYSKNCDAELLNDAMRVMFTHSLKSLDFIPPTQHALFQHAKRALLAAAFIWKQSLSKIPKIPMPSDWGWEWNTRTNQWVPFWTDRADVSHACSLLLHCGCVMACRGNCKCHRTGLRCSTLCKWEGGCNNDSKAIRDGKYLALPYSSAWRRSPIKINKFVFVRYVFTLLAQVFIFLIDRATHEKYRPFTC